MAAERTQDTTEKPVNCLALADLARLPEIVRARLFWGWVLPSRLAFTDGSRALPNRLGRLSPTIHSEPNIEADRRNRLFVNSWKLVNRCAPVPMFQA